jgi:hypothetical protein
MICFSNVTPESHHEAHERHEETQDTDYLGNSKRGFLRQSTTILNQISHMEDTETLRKAGHRLPRMNTDGNGNVLGEQD